MKNPKILITTLVSLALACAANAQPFSFDIQSGSNTQTGFTGVSSFPGSDGTVTLSVDTNPSGFRDRGVTAPITGNPDSEILRDLAFWSTSDAITFTFTGLALNTEYTATAWVFDSESGNSGKDIDFTTNGGTISYTNNSADASGSVLSLANLTSDGTGSATIVMDHTGGAGGAVSLVNGFQLAVVPEPSAFALLAGMFGLTWVMLRRRA